MQPPVTPLLWQAFQQKNENIVLWGSGAAANTFAKSVEKKLDQEIYLLARRMIF